MEEGGSKNFYFKRINAQKLIHITFSSVGGGGYNFHADRSLPNFISSKHTHVFTCPLILVDGFKDIVFSKEIPY